MARVHREIMVRTGPPCTGAKRRACGLGRVAELIRLRRDCLAVSVPRAKEGSSTKLSSTVTPSDCGMGPRRPVVVAHLLEVVFDLHAGRGLVLAGSGDDGARMILQDLEPGLDLQ